MRIRNISGVAQHFSLIDESLYLEPNQTSDLIRPSFEKVKKVRQHVLNQKLEIVVPPSLFTLGLNELSITASGSVTQSGGGPLVVPGDPLFNYKTLPENPPKNPVPYELKVELVDSVASLTWTFPYFLASGQNDSVIPALVPVIGVFLQRSVTANLPPNPDSYFYEVTRDVPATDSDWTTIHSWGPYATFIDAYIALASDPDADLQVFTNPYVDLDRPSTQICSYRLMMIVGPTAQSHKRFQLDWNVTTLIPSSSFTAVLLPTGEVSFSWTAPTNSSGVFTPFYFEIGGRPAALPDENQYWEFLSAYGDSDRSDTLRVDIPDDNYGYIFRLFGAVEDLS